MSRYVVIWRLTPRDNERESHIEAPSSQAAVDKLRRDSSYKDLEVKQVFLLTDMKGNWK